MDTAYRALSEAGDPRWAFGTEAAETPADVAAPVPAGADPADLAAYCLMLGDDALVMSHRLQQWCTRAPELEEEVALANIALDLLGQARLLLARAGAAEGAGRGEDDLAFFRDAGDFRNVRLAEAAGGDFAELMVRLLVFATWRLALLDRLRASRDPVLAAVADKGVKEVAYHRDHAAAWVVRLGDGTPYSRERTLAALAAVWPLVPELFAAHQVEERLAAAHVGVAPGSLRGEFGEVVGAVLAAAGLAVPAPGGPPGTAGREGRHTAALRDLLAELQSVARAFPGATW